MRLGQRPTSGAGLSLDCFTVCSSQNVSVAGAEGGRGTGWAFLGTWRPLRGRVTESDIYWSRCSWDVTLSIRRWRPEWKWETLWEALEESTGRLRVR